jgi:hypothetical protein
MLPETKLPPNGLLPPSEATLVKYGLTYASWFALAERDGFVCGICKRLPPSRRLHIDHKHVPGFKTMPPGARMLYVRGVACQFCNRFYLAQRMTLAKARNMVAYLFRAVLFNVARMEASDVSDEVSSQVTDRKPMRQDRQANVVSVSPANGRGEPGHSVGQK